MTRKEFNKLKEGDTIAYVGISDTITEIRDGVVYFSDGFEVREPKHWMLVKRAKKGREK